METITKRNSNQSALDATEHTFYDSESDAIRAAKLKFLENHEREEASTLYASAVKDNNTLYYRAVFSCDKDFDTADDLVNYTDDRDTAQEIWNKEYADLDYCL